MIPALVCLAVMVGTGLLTWIAYAINRYRDFKYNALFHPKFYRFNLRVFLPRIDRYLGWIHRDSEVKVPIK